MNKPFSFSSKCKKIATVSCLLAFPITAMAGDVYCPGGGGYIKVGMTQSQVIAACGQPSYKSKPTLVPNTRNVKVQQLIYDIGAGTAGRGNFQFEISPGGKTINLMVSIVANKVKSISLNNSTVNGATICPNGPFKVGDNVQQVLNACGQPISQNTSFEPIPQGTEAVKQEQWTIKTSDYGNTYKLTFKNGILESISQ